MHTIFEYIKFNLKGFLLVFKCKCVFLKSLFYQSFFGKLGKKIAAVQYDYVDVVPGGISG